MSMNLDDIKRTRRQRLKLLETETGGRRALAKRLDVSTSRISQLLNGHGPFSESTAREIEEKLDKRYGWLDEYRFSLDGVDENLDAFVRTTATVLQYKQLKEREFYSPEDLGELFVIILRRLFLSLKRKQDGAIDEDEIEEIIKSSAS